MKRDIKLYCLNRRTDYKLEGIKTMESKKFQLNKLDWLYIYERAKIFFLPLAIIYIPFVVANIEGDGFQWGDFGLNEFQLGALVLYVLNRVTTAVQLFLAGKK